LRYSFPWHLQDWLPVIQRRSNTKESWRIEFKTQMALSRRAVHDGLHEANVRGVRTFEGDHEASLLKICYMEGYDSVQDDNGNFHTDLTQTPGLSRRRAAECDRIIGIYEKAMARFDAEEKAKDAAYDRAHPQR
jgi:hypothetical protein